MFSVKRNGSFNSALRLGLTGAHGVWYFQQLAAAHIIDIPVDGNRLGHQRVIANAAHIGGDAGDLIFDCQPVDKLTFGRAGAVAAVMPTAGVNAGGLQAAGL